jgi:hypothetical protein
MIQRIKQLILAVTTGALLFAPMLAPVAVNAASATDQGLCNGAKLDVSNAACSNTDNATEANTRVNGIIKTVIDLFSLVVGIIAVIMIIIGGLKYITSGGDSGNVTGAKNTILYAVIGLVVVALAQFIVKFVLGKATKSDASIFLFR